MSDTLKELAERVERGEMGKALNQEISKALGESWWPNNMTIEWAIDWAEKALPGWRWLVEYDDHRGPSYGAQVKRHGEDWGLHRRCLADTPAAALLAALLRAKAARAAVQGER